MKSFIDPTILPSEITPKAIFEQRRALIKAAAAGSFGAGLVPWFARNAFAQAAPAGPMRLPKVWKQDLGLLPLKA